MLDWVVFGVMGGLLAYCGWEDYSKKGWVSDEPIYLALLVGLITALATWPLQTALLLIMAAGAIILVGIYLDRQLIMGESDSMLVAAVVLATPYLAFSTVLFGLALGVGYGVPKILRKEWALKTAFPFVPFIAAGFVLAGLVNLIS